MGPSEYVRLLSASWCSVRWFGGMEVPEVGACDTSYRELVSRKMVDKYLSLFGSPYPNVCVYLVIG